MKILMAQLRFDARRLIIRNAAFQFFCLGDTSSFLLVIYKSNGYRWHNGSNRTF
ncbi:hypothetical protein S101258_00857 [Lactiplantibacillus plantarum subsp. plantarum]|uniref:Uncharacterized protein n=1 Tax=Lactiplantibacillus plantarum subsp. plantarum TaxID=337330 RepID=A0A2S3U8I3_LACPN|nr:hypothetical protein S101258_00857 [Lactiplantibacillus plantarum subsp. plantarum]